MICPWKFERVVVATLLLACNSVSRETDRSTNNKNEEVSPYIFQDTNIKRDLFDGGYEGAILEGSRKENKMFPYKTSHTRLKVILTEDSTFVVSYLFFKSTPTPPDTVIYFLRRDIPQSSYYLRKEPRLKQKPLETKFNLLFAGKQIIPSGNKNYEIFKFKSKDPNGAAVHIWLPDIGIIRLESDTYDKSFILSFGPNDYRTKIIKDLLSGDSLY